MSYDVYLTSNRCSACGRSDPDVKIGNYTSNVHRIWRDALGMHLADMNGFKGEKGIPILDAAIEKLNDPKNLNWYQTMEPPNGWGNLSGATEYLTKILTEWRKNPELEIHISH